MLIFEEISTWTIILSHAAIDSDGQLMLPDQKQSIQPH
jgi:hypothetical protein